MKKRTKPEDLIIPPPIALPGDRVHVENYRKRPPQWESGECAHSNFHVSHQGDGGRWSYDVLLDRCGAKDFRRMHLCVGVEQIEREAR